MTLSALIVDWQYVIALAFVLVLSFYATKFDVFQPIFSWIARKIKSKRGMMVLISAVTSVLPINGRTVVSGGILRTIAPEDPAKRKKFAVVDYLNAHHFYFWSPLEASVLLPMAALHIGYWNFFGHIWPALLTVVVCGLVYDFWIVKEEDVDIVVRGHRERKDLDGKKYLREGIITVAGIFALMVAGNIVYHNSGWFDHLLAHTHKSVAIIAVLPLVFIMSWLFGSSEKFTGVVALTAATFGIAYLPLLFSVGWSGYMLSPFHKCMLLGQRYFGANWKDYYKVLAAICGIVVMVACVHTFTTGL
jgi:hypothetical protein